MSKHVNAARKKLEDVALKYARMKAFGKALENDVWVTFNHGEREDLEMMFLKELGYVAFCLLAELTVMNEEQLKDEPTP